MKKILVLLSMALIFSGCLRTTTPTTVTNAREVILLDTDWQFNNSDVEGAELIEIVDKANAGSWETVTVPHDWAISGEFDELIDAQETRVRENGEQVVKMMRGRTGGLPHVGVGWYRKSIEIPKDWQNKRIHLEFDGAMSHSKIYMNGEFVGEWPFGYASFGFDVSDYITPGQDNLLAVRLENLPFSSRWYPGAGLYRHVRMVVTEQVYVKQWGTYILTPDIEDGKGTVDIETSLVNKSGKSRPLFVETSIFSPEGNLLKKNSTEIIVQDEKAIQQQLIVDSPELWSVNSPVLYIAHTRVSEKNDETGSMKELDVYETKFGFRYFKFTSDEGFFLNGEHLPLQGVCLHHDLGPLGAAVNLASLRHRMNLLKEMGCNSIRTSHNPPAPEMLDLADEMGFLIIDEAFDEWKHPKVKNGYNTLWDEWAEKDMVAMIHRDRNHPSVILWSIGNEIREQGRKDGVNYARFLVDICKREDPSRPTTAGFDQWASAIKNGLAETVDVQGWNYKPRYYNYIHKQNPEFKMIGSESASTVSSRGEYFFPAKERVHYTRDPYHSSAFDMEFPRWATSPDHEFHAQDSFPFMAGEYVWTGIDYLGEPTPYNIEWPARSSYFGIIDLCGIPKDRYYLYQSRWTDKEVLHLLPHWNWEVGQKVSVHCYTSFERAELFLNGKSLGVREKDPSGFYTTYRLIWDDIIYEPGELKVVALDPGRNPHREAVIKTAGKPARIILESDRERIQANGKDLAFVTVSIVDTEGVLCPLANNLVNFKVKGAGFLRAVGNGDPTSLESFVLPYRKAFNGKCMAIIQSGDSKGKIKLQAESEGLQSNTLEIILGD